MEQLIGATLEGNRPLRIEIQSLVSPASYGTAAYVNRVSIPNAWTCCSLLENVAVSGWVFRCFVMAWRELKWRPPRLIWRCIDCILFRRTSRFLTKSVLRQKWFRWRVACSGTVSTSAFRKLKNWASRRFMFRVTVQRSWSTSTKQNNEGLLESFQFEVFQDLFGWDNGLTLHWSQLCSLIFQTSPA